MARIPSLALVSLSLATAACHDAGTGPTVDLRYASVSAGADFSCALTRDGRAFCWGDGLYGQLGRIIDSTYSSVPIVVGGDHRFTAIASGTAHTCGLATDGTVWCWGQNTYGQLGAASTSCSTVFTAFECAAIPVQAAPGTRFTAIGAGSSATCGVTSVGRVMCWGAFGGFTPTDPALIQDTGVATYQAVAPAGGFLCALTDGFQVRCWGDNTYGEIGTGAAPTPNATSPTAILDSVPRMAVTTAWPYGCALSRDGLAVCWGFGGYGTLGKAGVASSAAPVPVDSGKHFSRISAAQTHACGVANDGTAWCWGADSIGMLGEASLAPACSSPYQAVPCRPSPVKAGLADAPYVAIAAGLSHTCAVTQAGTAWCWGRNAYGSLGIGTVIDSRTPVQVLAADTTR